MGNLKLSSKLWFLNILFAIVIFLGVVLLFLDHKDSTAVISTMVAIPLTAQAGEMGIYAHAVAKVHTKPKQE